MGRGEEMREKYWEESREGKLCSGHEVNKQLNQLKELERKKKPPKITISTFCSATNNKFQGLYKVKGPFSLWENHFLEDNLQIYLNQVCLVITTTGNCSS